MVVVLTVALAVALVVAVWSRTRVRSAGGATVRASRTRIRAPNGAVVLLTGEMRFESEEALEAFRARLSDCRVLVATWAKYTRIARRLVAGEDDLLVLPQPRKRIPHTGAYQFELLQAAVRHFEERLRPAPVVVRMRTDAIYGEDFAVPFVERGFVAMESDHAMAADPDTFIRCYGNIENDLIARGVYMHREEKRSLLPNWTNMARSDLSNVDLGGWRTRWRWLDYPVEVFPPTTGGLDRVDDVLQRVRSNLMRLNALRDRPSVPIRMLTGLARVPKFDAESALLHQTLEHAAVVPLDHVDFVGREHRCPYRAPCLSL